MSPKKKKKRVAPPVYRFQCTKCGECCRRPGEVWATREELVATASYLGMSFDALVLQHLVRFDGAFGEFIMEESGACTFLQDNRCTINPVKPWQCAAYPFWPEVVESQASWDAEREECEGIGRGDPVELVDIRRWCAGDPFED